MADLKITITIPSAQKSDLIEAFADLYNYQATDNEGKPNPQSKSQFALSQVKNFIKNVFISYKAKGAETTRKELIETATNNISGATVE
jgi:hypothetical protein